MIKSSPIRPQQSGDVNLWWRWTVACGTGEVLGIAAAATTAVVTTIVAGEPVTVMTQAVTLVAFVLGGGVEGLLVGALQHRVLRDLVDVPRRSWIGRTVAVAATAWALGTTPSLTAAGGSDDVAGTSGPPLGLVLVGAAAMGLLFGAAFGVAQGPLLRGLDERAVVRWSVANALGWAVGLVWLFVAASIPDDGWPTGLIIVLAAAAGALAGLSVGAITGAALVRMHRE